MHNIKRKRRDNHIHGSPPSWGFVHQDFVIRFINSSIKGVQRCGLFVTICFSLETRRMQWKIAFPNPNKPSYETIPSPKKTKRDCSRLGFAQSVSIQPIPILRAHGQTTLELAFGIERQLKPYNSMRLCPWFLLDLKYDKLYNKC